MKITASLHKSPVKGKKYRAKFYKDGEYWKKTDFGATGYGDYTTHKDPDRKKNYLDRHRKNENWDDEYSAGALSRWVLWDKPDLLKSWCSYLRRFDLTPHPKRD